ncbi:MAG: hypothetical protein JSR98_22135 [Proteobacteria bacterium]|nr:hypothetical protein [Pseudomonadota bacterium]
MKLTATGLAFALAFGLARAAAAAPEVIVKCDGPLAEAMKFTNATKWQPYPNPDKSVTITRDKGRFSVELAGETTYASSAVIATPMKDIQTFKVLRIDGNELFHLEKGADGKPILKHTIRGGRDGTHLYNIRESILANCSVVSPDVAVSAPQAQGAGG